MSPATIHRKFKVICNYNINILLKECIRVLKQLQSKEEVLIAEDDSPPEVKGPNRAQAMRKWVSRSGITVMFYILHNTYYCLIVSVIFL